MKDKPKDSFWLLELLTTPFGEREREIEITVLQESSEKIKIWIENFIQWMC